MTHVVIPLWRYAARVGYRECAFFGVNHPDNVNYACGAVWTGAQRSMIEWALGEAQEEVENELGFFLRPDWVTNERHEWACRMLTNWTHVIEGGVLSDTLVGNSLAVNYATDPATVSMALGTMDPEDLYLYHEDTDTLIYPTGYTVAVGVVTWNLPWCRMVDPAFENTDEGGLDYADVATWGAPNVDVHLRVNDPSSQATLVWRNRCKCQHAACGDYRKTGCLYVSDIRVGVVEVQQATYLSGAWSGASCGCSGSPDYAIINYRAGWEEPTKQAEDMVLRLAHSKMAEEPCGCDITQRLWKRDRNVPAVMTRERVNCPFGMSDGAWIAWRWASRLRLMRSRGNL